MKDGIPQWIVDEVNAEGRRFERESLIAEHGEEKADEILLSRELGDLTYVPLHEEEYP